ncbi:SUF system NifU family Fe-S cluster assembly protein [Candidatus Bathyarchaeota archaeon]|jgi:nitrogen fixation NifU-like protein|nr:SUF system NifU family Fe-S cluster assembly protein [Candidatus Bathyarchaeota archaeon]
MSTDIYKEAILDHFRHPRNYGDLPDANARAREANVLCGDVIEMQLKLSGDRIDDLRFRGQGCAVSIASTSMLTELVKGKEVSEIKKLGKKDIIRLLRSDPGPTRIECALLGLKVLKMAVHAHLGIKMPEEPEAT